ncbi:MAG TPA: acyl-CoA dehydrogenase family protein [Steroidobacteraceae bacterium]|nr:acyl-CoA dehydrogenase family protein [Steroidobacteraceae bacterium]
MPFAREERLLLERSLDRYIADTCSLESRRALQATGEAFRRDDWAQLADLGVLALAVPEDAGGLGGSLEDVVAVTRALGAGVSLVPYLPCAIVAGRLLASLRGQATAEDWLARLLSGEGLYGLAHLERGDRGQPSVARTTLVPASEGWTLDGSKLLVPVAPVLDGFVVTARDPGGALSLCFVPASAAGVSIRAYRTVDGQQAGEVVFQRVAVREAMCWREPGVEALIDSVATYAAVAAAADSLGCMQQLLERTATYLNDRKQFGQPLARFQALKHRLVDGYASVEQATALLEIAAQDAAPTWRAAAAAAKAYVDEHAIRLGHEAIQMHGAMGLTDELAISHLHKRIVANALLYGDVATQLDALAGLLDLADPAAPSAALPFAHVLEDSEATFRDEVRAFLDAELDAGLRDATRRLTCTFAEKDVTNAWHARLNARGWLAPLWPREYGGTGWSAVERFLFEYESALAGAPERIPMGLRYVGPILAQYGSDWQKDYFLPRILSGEHYWAQGFSEPGAGSDLAAVKTTAVREGDQYVVNGSKMWTTNAHVADWVFCLVRTEATARQQDGISFLLIDLRTPGIRIEPIALLAVDHEVNQVFFDDVHVPARNLVGEAGRGWQYAKFLLELERGGTLACGRVRAEFHAVKEQVRRTEPALLQDRLWRHRLASLEVRLMALEAHEFRCARTMTRATAPGVGGSLTKLVSSELQQDITQLGLEVAGLAGLELEPRRPLASSAALGYPGLDLDLVAMPRYLNTRATTIFAGSSEIQREIIARHILGFRG